VHLLNCGHYEPLGTLVAGMVGHGGCVIGRILSRMEKRQLQASAASELKAHGQISALCVASGARLKCLWLCLVVHCGLDGFIGFRMVHSMGLEGPGA
jgi:hypothetical protein